MIRRAAVIIAAGLAACRPDAAPPAADEHQRELGPLPVAGTPYTIVLDELVHGRDTTVLRLRIRSPDGAIEQDVMFERPTLAEHGMESTIGVRALTIAGESGEGLLVFTEHLPSAPLTGISMQLFAPRDGRLRALWQPLTVMGSFPALPGSGVQRRLQPGDIMAVEVWRFYFGVTVPLRIALDCEPGTQTCISAEPSRRDPISGMGVYDVRAEPREIAETTTVTLYEAPRGEDPRVLEVGPATQVEIVEVAAEVQVRGPYDDITAGDEWLRVRIDGVEGWITGEESFAAIGLVAAG